MVVASFFQSGLERQDEPCESFREIPQVSLNPAIPEICLLYPGDIALLDNPVLCDGRRCIHTHMGFVGCRLVNRNEVEVSSIALNKIWFAGMNLTTYF